MSPEHRKIGVLTGGGDAPGLNAVIRAVVKAGCNAGLEVFGLEDSFDGLLDLQRMKPMTPRDVTGILRLGGTILGTTNRGNPFEYPTESGKADYSDRVVENFQKAGLDVNNPPKTWKEVFEAARKIKSSGAAPCGFTSTWLTWIQLETFAAWNNVPYGTKENGLAGLDVELKINAPIFVNHFQAIADLAKEGVFRYGGRTSEAKNLFLSGECAIMTESSGGLGDVLKSGLNFGTGQLPYDSTAQGAPQNTIPGGASLWVFAGHKPDEYKGVAAFFKFLSQTDIQSRLHQVSGYLPVTLAAYDATKKSGFYEKNPGRETPILQMMGKAPTENSKGVRLVNLPQVRDIENEEFEKMLAGQQTAKQALDSAVKRGNAAIKQAIGQ